MKISKQELKQLGASKYYLSYFIKQTGGTEEAVNVADLIGGLNTTADLLWIAGAKLGKEAIVKFACKCALINVEEIKPYTSEGNYNLIYNFLLDPTKDTYSASAVSWSGISVFIGPRAISRGSAFAAMQGALSARSSYVEPKYAAVYAQESAAWAASAKNNKEQVTELLKNLFDTTD